MTNRFLITEEAPDFFLESLKELGFTPEVIPGISQTEIEKIIHLYKGLVIRGKILANKSLLEKGIHLQYILRPGSGLDIIDVHEANKKGITLLNSPEGNKDAVAEHTMGLLLSLMNKIPQSFNDIKSFRWTRQESTGTELKGKVVGIIGYGHMGSAVAEKLSIFGTTTMVYDKYKIGYGTPLISETNLETIYKNADIVSFHIPLDKYNQSLVNKQYISNFQKPIYLINTSRGKILNTEDLLQCIYEEKVLGAALDVLENEQLDSYYKNEKDLLKKLINTNKVILTPHVAGWTHESAKKIYSILIDKLKSSIEC